MYTLEGVSSIANFITAYEVSPRTSHSAEYIFIFFGLIVKSL